MTTSNPDDKIISWLKSEATEGRFEHSLSDLCRGTELSRGQVQFALGALESGQVVGVRVTGTQKKQIKHYYLSELQEMASERWP